MKKILLLLVTLIGGFLYTAMAAGLTLTSTAFAPNQTIPLIFTCEGRDKTPDLSWSDIPKGTASFVLIMEDLDAPGGIWVHWVMFNIPATVQQWQTNTLNIPAGTLIGKNSWGEANYRGPCPPPGKDHHYVFTLYALDRFLDLPTGATAPEIQDAIKDHILGQAQLIGIYRRSV